MNSKAITFKFGEKDYTLEYTRDTVRQMELSGFNIHDIDSKPQTCVEKLWNGAFLAHHRNEKASVVEAIYNKMPRKQDLLEALIELYNEPLNALLEEPDEDEEGNIEWRASL